MNLIYKLLLYVFFFLASVQTQLYCQPIDLPFQDGEIITYDVYYNWKFIWVPAGQVKFKFTEKADHYFIKVTGKSFDSYNSVFEVNDDYVSYVDKPTFLPSRFRRDVLEGNYVRFDSISFNRKDSTLTEYIGKSREDAVASHHQLIQDGIHDLLSAIYLLRQTKVDSLVKGDKIPFSVFFDQEKYDLDINYISSERKKIKSIGTIDCYRFQPQLVSGTVFNDGDIMDIWVSKDKNKIPVLIESPISVGSVKAVLKSVEGSKFPFTYDK